MELDICFKIHMWCGALPPTLSVGVIQMKAFAFYVTSGLMIVPISLEIALSLVLHGWRESISKVAQSYFSKHNNVFFDLIGFICSHPYPYLDKKSKLYLVPH